jgi:TolB protein
VRRLLSLMLFLAGLLPAIACARDGYLEVTAPGDRLLQLAVAPPVPLAGDASPEVTRELGDVFSFDMGLSGLFSVQAAVPAGAGSAPGDFSLGPWQALGVDLLVKSGYRLTGGTLVLEARLFDVRQGKELTAKRYTGPVKELRRMAHTFSDEVLRAVTGEPGPFTGRIAFVAKLTGNKEVYLMDYDGANVQRLTRNGSINLNPDFSPAGKEIVYTSYQKGNPDLYRRDIGSGVEARISSRKGINATAAWSPDGSRIALAMSKDGVSAIYLIDKEGKEQARLTRDGAIAVSPAWSPDGRQIAFVSDRLGKPQVFIMAADGSDVRRLTTSGAYNVSPRWSPKGDRIVYCRQEPGGFQIHAINPDGSNDIRLTTEGSNEHPRWSPDGRFITYSSRRGGKEAIYVMRADGTGQTPVSRVKGDASHPTWSPRW